jgi:ribosomal protein L29
MSKLRESLGRIRDLPDDELLQALGRSREELFRLRLGNYTNQVENTVSLRLKRREVARILTIQRARELELESQQASGAARAPAEGEDAADETEQTVADRARAAVGRPRTPAKSKSKGKASSPKSAAKAKAKPAKPAKKPAAKAATSKAKPAGKTSKKKSGKE